MFRYAMQYSSGHRFLWYFFLDEDEFIPPPRVRVLMIRSIDDLEKAINEEHSRLFVSCIPF
jgi:hypothetical protein